jgi:hypothetical protein
VENPGDVKVETIKIVADDATQLQSRSDLADLPRPGLATDMVDAEGSTRSSPKTEMHEPTASPLGTSMECDRQLFRPLVWAVTFLFKPPIPPSYHCARSIVLRDCPT